MYKRGQTLIEILVAIGLTSILLPGLLTAFVASREGKAQESQRLQATALLRETEEAVRSARNSNWSNIAAMNGTYHPQISGDEWTLASGPESIGQFTRSLVVSAVQRDDTGNIVTSGGTVDTSTKQVVSTVSWETPHASSISSTNYLERYKNNASWNQTTQANFSAGTLTNTVVVNGSGGEVQLSVGGASGTWQSPIITGTFDAGGSASGLSVYLDGNYAYLATTNAGSGNDLSIVDITNPNSPSLTGGINLGVAVNSIHVSGNYAYLATSGNSSELTIVNITNKTSPIVSSTLNLGGNQDAYGIYVSGNYAYVGKQAGGGSSRELYVVNVSNPSSPSQSGTLEIGSDVNNVHIAGNYAYLATSSDSTELIVVNISNPSSPSQVGTYNTPSASDGIGVYTSGTTAYLTTGNNSSGSEFYIINANSPANPTLIGSFDLGAQGNDVHVSGTLAMIATNNNSLDFQIINIATPSSPTLYGNLDLTANANHVFVVGDYAYVPNNDNNGEMVIIKGGSPTPYATSGTYESQTFDAATLSAFNHLTFSINEPPNTNVIFQLAINDDNSTWNYFGSFESPAAIPLANINGRYVRYKATLTGDGTQTPTISDVGINYSP